MDATKLYLANGMVRTVKGRAEDIGNVLKARTMSNDDGIRQFTTVDGGVLTVNRTAVLVSETAAVKKATFGFARAMEV